MNSALRPLLTAALRARREADASGHRPRERRHPCRPAALQMLADANREDQGLREE